MTLADFQTIIREGGYVVLDTETTGLERGEICQIAIVEDTGRVFLDTLVKTRLPIPADATRIHGITDAMVKDAPTFQTLLPTLTEYLTGRNVIVYNAVYDRKMLHQSAEAWDLPKTDWKVISQWFCAMEAFAELYGDWNEYRQSYRWQKLVVAAAYYRIPQQQPAHTALADALTTLELVKAMAR